MKPGLRLLCVLLLAPCICMHGQNAPVTTAGTVSTPGLSATVPVTASAFASIGSCGLKLVYDPEIAIATSVTSGPLLGGNLNTNLTVPGTIILGWYAFPGITLPDSTVIFNIQFSKVAAGTAVLAWLDDGYSCFYGNDSSVILNDLPTADYYFDGSVTFMSEAPVTMAPSVKAGPGAPVDIPVRVAGFHEIGKITLSMQYDPSVLAFQSWTNTSGFPGLTVGETAPGTLLAEATADTGGTGVTLADSSILYVLHFLHSEGSTQLSWNVNGGSCTYAGPPPSYPPLFDEPKSAYYLDGAVTPALGIGDPGPEKLSVTCYPNPFGGSGTVSWTAPSPGMAAVAVFNVLGERVISFTSNVEQPGVQNTELRSDRLMPGIYTVRILLGINDSYLAGSVKVIVSH